MRIRALLLLAIAAGIHAGPIGFEENTCSTTCVPTVKFGYEPGRTYRFEYEAETVTAMTGASEEQSAIHVRSTVDINVLSPCELMLQLRDTNLEESDPSDLSRKQTSQNNGEFRAALEANALRFSFQDGRVESVCATEDEPKWVVNFKRGVLSAFQNSMENFDNDATVSETDISGNCQAAYTISDRGFKGVSLTKSKNLLGCTERTGYFTSLQATSYRVPSEVQSLPLIKSTHECEQTVSSSGILQRSECTESHKFRPFSHHDTGAITTVKQVLTFKSEIRTSTPRTGSVTQRSNLLFEHEPRENGKSNDQSEVISIIEGICKSKDIRPETPKLFSKLVYAMRQLDVYTLKKIHRMVENGRVCSENTEMAKKFFHDAIPAAGTAASVALIHDLTSNGEITGPEADVWITSLAFIQEPTSDMIKEAKEIIASDKPSTYLAVSSLVNSFCKTTDCEGNEYVQTIIRSLTQNLGYNCKVEPEEKVLMSLKALGNAGIGGNTVTTLVRCAANEDASTEIRLAAIQAFRRLPCSANREDLMTLLMNTNQDSEIRIAAYLGIMTCPTEVILTQVKHVLESEEVNQVGSFIWTHLTNLKETSDPLKQDIRAIVEDEKLVKEFNMDVRKFSRNYEGSFFLESLNAGAGYESNLIWSPSSFLPRSAMLNLTVDMFGKSVNLLEIGGRMEGMEKYLEKFFGPEGYFPESTVSNLIKGKIDSVDRALHDKVTRPDPKASAYMKMFGNELRYFDLTGIEQGMGEFNILDILIKLAQNHEIDITRSTMFLDTELTVPTAIGLPLKLAVNGTASIDIKIGGKMDIRRAATLPSSFDIDGYVKPSGAVTFSSTMGVDACMSRTGLKMVTTLHSSTEMNGQVTLQESKILNAKFNVPKDKIEILNVESKFFIVHREQEKEQKMLTDNVIDKSYCTGSTIGTVTGVKICGDMKLPLTNKAEAPYFPMTGPVSFHLSLENADTHKSYEFEARVESKKERREGKLAITNVARLAFNTPGSQVDREFLAEYNLDRLEKTLTAQFRTPWKQATLAGSVTNTPEMKNANIQLAIDGRWKYTAVAETAITQKDSMVIYTPNLSITAPGMEDISLVGKAKIAPMDKLDVDFTLNNVFSTPVTLRGGIDKATPNRFTTDLTFQSPVFNTHVSGFTVIKDGLVSTRTEFKYDYNRGSQQQFVLNGKFKDTSNNYATKYQLNTAIQTSEYPDYNMQVEGDFIFNKRLLESSFELKYGNDPKDRYKRIAFKETVNFDGTWTAMTANCDVSAIWRAMGINANAKVTHKHDISREINTQAVITYSPGKEIKIDLDSKKETASPMDRSTDLKVTIPGRDMRFYTGISEKQPNQYEHEFIGQWQAGKQIRTVTEYSMNRPTHQIKTDFYRPSGAVSTFSGEVVADLEDFKSKMNLNHEGQAYSTAVEYTYLFKPNKKQVGGKFDLALPQRHVILQTEASAIQDNYAANFLTQWDADNDASKKVNINGRLGLSNNYKSHEGQIKVIYPGRKATLTVNQNLNEGELTHHSELSWHPRKTVIVDINGNLNRNSLGGTMKLSTPFTNDITLSGNAQRSSDEMEGHIEVNYGKVISTDVSLKTIDGWKNVESSIVINTPFTGVEELSLTTKHNIGKGQKLINAELARNSDKIILNGNLEKINGKHEGVAEVIYPGRKVGLKFTCHKTPTDFIHHSEISWSSAKPITLDIETSLTDSAFKGIFKVSSPFTNRDISVNINGKNNPDNAELHAEIDYGKKISADIVSTSSNGWKNMQNSLIVHTPFQGLDRMTMKTNHNLEGQSKNIHIEFEKNQNKVELDAAGKFEDNSVEGSISVITPFTRPITLKTSATLQKSQADGHLEIDWQNEKTELAVEAKFNEKEIEGKVEIKTPYTEAVTFKGEASFDNNEVKTKLQVECQNQKVEIKAEGKCNGNAKEGTIEVETPYTDPIKLTVSATLDEDELASSIEFEWQKKSIQLNVNGKYQNRLVEGGIEIKTPYTEPIAIQSTTTFTSQNANTKLDIEWSNQKIELEANGKTVWEIDNRDLEAIFSLKTPFTQDINIQATHQDDGKQFKSNLMATWSPRKQISIEFIMNHNQNGIYFNNDGKLTFASPFVQIKDIVVSWDNDFQGWNNIKSRNEIQYNRKAILLNLDHAFKTTSYSQKLNTAVTMETPFSEVRNINAGVGYVINRRKVQGSASLTHNERTYFTLSVDSTVVKPEVTANIKFQSIIPHAEDISLDYRVNYESEPRTSILELKWAPEKVITFNNELTPKGDGFSGNMRLTTPFRILDRVLVNFDHEKIDGVWKSKGSVEYAPSKIISMETGFGLEQGLVLSLDMSAPCSYFRKLTCSLDHRGYGSNINHKSAVNYEMDRGNINYEGDFNMRGMSGINANAEFSTPFKYFRNHKMTIQHGKEGEEYQTKITYQFNRKTINVETEYQNTNGLFKFNTNTKTSFRAAPSLEFGIEHQTYGNQFSGKAKVNSNILEQPIEFNGNYGKTGSQFNGDFKLSTPFTIAENVGGQLSFDAPNARDISLSAEVELDPRRQITFETMFSFKKSLKLSSSLKTPFRQMRLVSLNLDHTQNVRIREIESTGKFELMLEDGTIELSENFKWDGFKLLTGDLTLKTPYRNADKFALKVHHEIADRDAKVNEEISFEYPSNKKISLTRSIMKNRTYDALATTVFKSPFSGFENIQLVTKFNTEKPGHFDTQMALTYAPEKTIGMDIMLDMRPRRFNIKLETPFEQMSYCYMEGTLTSGSNSIETNFNGEITLNRRTTSLSGTSYIRQLGSKIESGATFKSNFRRFEDISADGSFEVKQINGVSHGIVISANINLPSNPMTFNTNLNFPSAMIFDGDMSFTGPVDLGLKLKHRGDFRDFENSFIFNKDQETVTYEGKFSPINGNFKLTTPYRYNKVYELQFNVDGRPVDFMATAGVTYAPNKRIGSKAAFKLDNGMKGSFEFVSPFLKDIKVNINHEGTTNFKHTTDISYGKKLIQGNANFQTYPTIEGNLKITSPFPKLRSMEAELAHSGSLQKFTTVVNFNHNNKNTLNTEINFDRTRTLTGNVKIDSSFGRMFSMDFDHDTNFPEFTTTGTINIGSKRIALDSAFNINPTEGHFKLQTPWEIMKNIDATVKHNGPWKNFESTAKFVYNNGNPITANLKFSQTKTMTGSFELTTPFECLRSLSCDFSHKLTPKVLQTQGKINLNGKEITGDVDIEMTPEGGEMQLKTPIPHMEDIKVTLTHQSEFPAFDTTLRIVHNEFGTVQVSGKFELSPIQGEFKIETPFQYMRNAAIQFTHEGSLTRFSQTLDVEHNVMGKVQYSGNLEIAQTITGEFTLKTPCPYIKETSIKINHEGSISDFASHIEFNHNKLGKAVLNTKYKPHAGNVEFTSPCPYLKHVYAKFTHADGKTDAEISYNGKTIKGSAEIEFKPINAVVTVELPSGQTYGFNLNHKGKLRNFKTEVAFLKDKTSVITSQMKLDTRSGISSEFQLTSPFTSDIVLTYNHNGNLNQFTCNGNFKINRKQVLNGELNFKLRPLEVTLDLETPYTGLKQMKAAVNHAGQVNNFRTNVDFEHNYNNKYHGDVNFKLTANDFDLDMHTPLSWLQHLEISGTRQGELQDFQTNVAATVNDGKKYTVDVAFKLTDGELNLDLKTPCPYIKHIEATAKHTGSLENFKTNAEFTYNDGEKYAFGVAFEKTSTELNLEIQSPFSWAKKLELATTFTGKLNDFESSIAIAHNNGRRFEGQVAFAISNTMLKIDLQTPLSWMKQLHIAATIEGSISDLKTTAEIVHNNGNKYAGELTYKVSPNQITFDLRTPLQWLQHFEMTAELIGTIDNFQSSLEIRHNDARKYQMELKYELTPTELKIELKTPISWIKHLEIGGEFTGSIDNFRTSLEVTHNNGRKYQGELSLRYTSSEINVELKTPLSWLRNLEVAAQFTGTIESFSSSLAVTHNNGGTYQGEITYELTPTKISIDLKTPLSWMRHVEVATTFSGNLRNFRTTLSASYNDGGRYEADVAFKITPTELSVNLKTPVSWMRNLDITATFTGSLQNFRTIIQATRNNGGQYHADVVFKLNPGTLTIKIETPHASLRKLHIAGTHSGDRQDFRTNFEMTHNDDQKFSADASFKQYPLEGRINLQTPWAKMRDSSLSVRHTGDKQAFESVAEIIVDGNSKFKANADFRRNPLTGSVTITTPFTGAEVTTITFSHSGNYNTFQSHGEINIFSQKYTVDSSFNKSPFTFQAVVTTPVRRYERLEFNYNHKGNFKTVYSSHADLTYKAGKKVEVDVNFKFYKRLNMDVSLKTPFRNVATTVKYQNSDGVINSLAEINYGSGKNIKASLDINKENGQLQITTPFSGLEQLVAEYDNQFTGNELTSKGSINFNGKQMTYTANGQYSNLANMGMKVEVRTPFSNAEYFMLSGKTEGDMRSFISEIDIILPSEYSVKGALTLDTTKGIKVNLKSNINIIEDILFEINHATTGRTLATNGELTYGRTRLMSFVVDMTKGRQSMDGKVTFSSPVKYLETLVAEVHVNGNLPNIKSNALFSWADGKQIEIVAEHNSEMSKFSFNSPITHPITMELNRDINSGNMDIVGLIGWGNDQAINIKSKVTSSGSWTDFTFNANFEITTPFRKMSHLSFDNKHQHSSTMIDSTITCQHNRRNIAESKVTLNSNNGAITVDAPWPFIVNMKYNRNRNDGELTMDSPFTVDARYTISGDRMTIAVTEPIRVDGAVQFTRNGGDITINTPFEVEASYTLQNNEASLSIQKPMRVEARCTYARNAGRFTMEQPFEVDASYNINDNGAGIEIEKPFPLDARYTYAKNSGSFSMEKPYPVDASYRINRNGGSFIMQQPISIDATARYNRDGASFVMQNPYPVDVSYSLENDGASFNMKQPIAIDASGKYNRNGASFMMTNPYPVDASYTYTGKEGSFKMQSPYQIDAGYSIDRDGASVNMRAPYEVDARYRINGNTGSVNMEKPYPIDASYNIGRNTGSVSVRQPYPIEAEYNLGESEGKVSIQEPVPFDMSYRYTGKHGSVILTKPMPMSASYDINGYSLKDISGTFEINWNTNKGDSNAKVEFMHKCDSTQYILKKAVSLKTILPTRTTVLSGSIEKSASRFMQSAEIAWDQAKNREISYLIDVNDKSAYSKNEYDLITRLNTPIRSMELLMNHEALYGKYTSKATLNWDSSRDTSKSIVLQNAYEVTGPTHKSELTISSPLMNRDVILKNEFTINNGNVFYACRHELQYSDDSRDNVLLTTRFADDGNTRRGNHNYTGAISMVHPRSTIDMQINTFAAVTDVLAATGIKVNYMKADREVENALIRAEINNIKRTINVELDTPFKKAEIRGLHTKDNGIYKYSIVAQDESSQVSTDLTINRPENNFNVEAHLNPSNPSETITFRGNYLSPTSLQVQALHSNGRGEITDSEISINMENGQLLRTKMHWRPALWEDIKEAGTTLVTNIMEQAQNLRLFRQIKAATRREVEGKIRAIKNSLPSCAPLKEFLSSEAESFYNDFKVVKREFNKMYWQNEFFLKDIDTTITKTVKIMYKVVAIGVKYTSRMLGGMAKVMKVVSIKAMEFLDDYVEFTFAMYEKYGPTVIRKLEEIITTVGSVAGNILSEAFDIVSDVIYTTLDLIGEVAAYLKPYVETAIRVYAKITKLCIEICSKIQEKYEAVMARYPFNRFGSWYNTAKSTASKVGNWMSDVNLMGPIYNAHLSVADKINGVTEKLAQHADRISEKYASVIYTAHKIIGRNVENYIHKPASEYIRQWLSQARDQAEWAYNYLGVEDMCKEFLERVMDWGIDAIKTNAFYLTDKYLHLDLTKIVSYDPRNGDIDFQIWIPDELPSIQKVPFTNIKWSDLWDRLMHIQNNMNVAVPDEFNPWDYYYQYKPASYNPLDWIPPFKAIAMQSGQHIVTFDRSQYEFLGTCSYILARDVLDGSFTAIKDYDKDIYKISVDGKQIDVAMTGQVSIDGAPTEIPIEFESTTITRDGDAIIITSRRGFNMIIDTHSELFTLEVSGWYYNKLAGLLGTYTNEHFDDFIMGNGDKTDNFDRFTDSWQVGACDRHTNAAAEHFVDESKSSGRICKFLFESRASPLRNCFKVVNPEKFLKACVNDVEETGDDGRGVCKAVDMYAMICKKKGVKLHVPRPCKKCQDETQSSNPNSADVLFIIEQKQCNNDMVSKIDNLALMVDKALDANGLRGNRFGMIGFGGKGIHDAPHSHTVGGKLMGISREMKPAAESLLEVENGENNDAVGALKYALNYPFRAGVAKTVIMITCGPCSEEGTGLDEVKDEMEKAGIQLHVLVEHQFAVHNDDVSPKTSYLYGIDSGVAYTKTDVRDRELNGDSELHKQLVKPNNRCAKLALDSNGSFFNLQKLKEGRVRYQKHFMDVFSRRVAKTSKSDECSVCECNEEGIKTCRPCQNSVLLGRPDEEPEQFYNQDFERDFQEYINTP